MWNDEQWVAAPQGGIKASFISIIDHSIPIVELPISSI